MKVKRGKHAMVWAKELRDYVAATHGGPAIRLFKSCFGNVQTLYWTVDFENMQALLTWQHNLVRDPGYLQLSKNSVDIVVAGSVEDTILESV
jgi:hypothetical protein